MHHGNESGLLSPSETEILMDAFKEVKDFVFWQR